MNENLKVQAHHLERGAYLYIRQSSMRQVIENVESTKRQYGLRGRAIGLGAESGAEDIAHPLVLAQRALRMFANGNDSLLPTLAAHFYQPGEQIKILPVDASQL